METHSDREPGLFKQSFVIAMEIDGLGWPSVATGEHQPAILPR
jgi:hypothetical protein